MQTKSVNGLYIGTSGWMYKDWGERFYPKDMKRGFLTHLSREFNTVEVNSSFYHLPRLSTFQKWRGETPADFRFAVKLSRYITHQRKLLECREPLERFLFAAAGLEEKLAVVLIQLPPSLPFEEERLREFLKDLRAARRKAKIAVRFALEPRHRSWMESAAAVRPLLRREGIALVFPHSAKIPSFPPERENVMTDFVYVRFHGPSEFAASRYGARRLSPWAARIRAWRRQKLGVFVYFNNDVHGHAVDDARTLKSLRTPRRSVAGTV